MWILGGYKCSNVEGAKRYSKEVEGDFTCCMTVNRNNELIFDYNNETFGVAFKLDQEMVSQGMHLVLSLVNPGKIRIVGMQRL